MSDNTAEITSTQDGNLGKQKNIYKAIIWCAVFGSLAILIYGLSSLPASFAVFKNSYPRPGLVKIGIQSLFNLEGGYYQMILGLFFFLPSFAFVVQLGSFLVRKILKFSGLPHTMEYLVTSFAVGAGTISMLLGTVGLLGYIHRWMGFVLFFAGFICILPTYRLVSGSLHALLETRKDQPAGKTTLLLKTAILIWIACMSTRCLSLIGNPDVMEYHWANVSAYINDGSITANIYNIFTYFPQNAEMIYLWQFLIGTDLSAKMFNFSIFVLIAFMIVSFVGKKANRWAGWFACALFVFTPLASLVSQLPKNDMMLALFTFMAIFLTVSAFGDHEDHLFKDHAQFSHLRYLFLAGLMIGGALGTKYTALPQFAALFGLILVYFTLIRKFRAQKIFLCLGVFIAGAAFFSFLWFFRNLLLTSNPFYPFLSNIFQTQFQAEWHLDSVKSFYVSAAISVNQMRSTFFVEQLLGTGLKSGVHAYLSPLLVFLIPSLFLLIRRKSGTVKYIVIAAVLQTLFSLSTFTQIRMLTGQIAILTVVIGICVGTLCLRAKRLRLALSVMVILLLLNPANRWAFESMDTGLLLFFNGLDPIQVDIRQTKREVVSVNDIEFLKRYVNKNLPKESRILFVGETRAALFERKFFANSGYNKPVAEDWLSECKTEEDVEEVLRQHGVTHLLVVPSGLIDIHVPAPLLHRFILRQGKLVVQTPRKNAFIYKILPQLPRGQDRAKWAQPV